MIGFRMPTRVHIEPGAVTRLPEAARSLGLQSVLIVADPGIRDNTEWLGTVEESLRATGIRTQAFTDLEANPRTTTATAAADALRAEGLDGVVALGGGSAIDTAKAAAMLANNELRIEQYEGKSRYANAPRPMIAIPTTCGAGSEVTWVSVLTHEPTRSKMSIKGESMFPDQALSDADLLCTLPPSFVAWTGLDALTHAVECVTCTAANAVSDALAAQAAGLIFRYLPRAASDVENDHEAREAMMRASTLAGLAFGNADVAAVHCLSESIGGYHDVPHGLANAVLLEPVMRYHRPYIEDRLAWLDTALFPQNADMPQGERCEHFLAELDALCRGLSVPPFAELGVAVEDYDRIAEWAVRNGSNRSNPQPMSPASYRQIMEGLQPG